MGGDTNSIWPSALPRLKRSNVIRTQPYAPYRHEHGNATGIQRSSGQIHFIDDWGFFVLYDSKHYIMFNVHMRNLFLPHSLRIQD